MHNDCDREKMEQITSIVIQTEEISSEHVICVCVQCVKTKPHQIQFTMQRLRKQSFSRGSYQFVKT